MEPWAEALLCCPDCGGSIETELFSAEVDEEDGLLRCQNCQAVFPLIGGIPRFVDWEHLEGAPSYRTFIEEHSAKLTNLELAVPGLGDDPEVSLGSLEARTDHFFGYQWERFSDWGWTEGEADERRAFFAGATDAATRSAWRTKSLLTEPDIGPGGLILDAGCGNGRFTRAAASNGGSVVGVDIGTATVEAAHDNCREDDIQIVQANLLQLPFTTAAFDTVFSIGVLHHTGVAQRAFVALVDYLKPEGVMTIHCYYRLNPTWEFNDAVIRSATTRLSVSRNIQFAKLMAFFAQLLYTIHPKALHAANLFVRLQPTVPHMFDWYSAPTASHHTYSEIERWFIDNGLVILQTNKTRDYDDRTVLYPWAATVKGKKLDEAGSGGHHPWFH